MNIFMALQGLGLRHSTKRDTPAAIRPGRYVAAEANETIDLDVVDDDDPTLEIDREDLPPFADGAEKEIAERKADLE